jgi:hypothetical protein
MRGSASSRERLLAALDGAVGAPAPCCFMIFRALRSQCKDEFEFAARQVELGLDARVQVEDLPFRLGPTVAVRDWVDGGVLHREYETPVGALTACAKRTDDWPHGEHIPIFDDYFTPRALEFPVAGPEDLPALRHLLAPPRDEDVAAFRERAKRCKEFAVQRGLLLAGGWKSYRRVPGEDRALIGDNGATGAVIDALMWLCGGTQPLLWAYDEPEFLRELIGVLEDWNRQRLELHLEAGAELVVRRAWYEGTEFWSPMLYREFILPGLKREVRLAHQAGARFGYIITSGMSAIADLIIESGVDVILGVDPGQGKGTTLGEARRLLGGKVALWGGVSGPLVVEEGTEHSVREAVAEAISALASTGRFILSPVDNVRADTEGAWRNVRAFIRAWQSQSG